MCRRTRPTSTPSSAAPTRCRTRSVYTILDGVKGQGHYVGTYMAWGVNNTGWWGEGEIKFFMDGDGEFPTICGTGTEDYFCGAYNFDVGMIDPNMTSAYREFTTPYAGLPQVIRPDGIYQSQTALRHVPLAHHGPDPLRARTCASRSRRSAGARNGKRRYLPLQDDIASVAYWYQTLPTRPVPGAARPRLPRGDLRTRALHAGSSASSPGGSSSLCSWSCSADRALLRSAAAPGQSRRGDAGQGARRRAPTWKRQQVDALRASLADAFGLNGTLLEQYFGFLKRALSSPRLRTLPGDVSDAR